MNVRRSPGTSTASAAEGAHGKHGVIAVGASAGGLRSLFKLLGPMPATFSVSTLVVLHLSPEHPNHLAKVLARKVTLQVRQASDGELMLPGTVYVAVPNRPRADSQGRGARRRQERPAHHPHEENPS